MTDQDEIREAGEYLEVALAAARSGSPDARRFIADQCWLALTRLEGTDFSALTSDGSRVWEGPK